MAEILPAGNEAALRRALELLESGEPVVVPTDTVYGVATMPTREAVKKLFDLKRRPLEKPIPLLLADGRSLPRYVPSVPSPADVVTQQLWPGAVTVILEADPPLAELLGSRDGSIGFRVPDNDPTRSLIRLAGGALAVTSANPSGESECNSAQEVQDRLGDAVTLILDGGITSGSASTVLKATDGELQIVRSGPLDAEVAMLIQMIRG